MRKISTVIACLLAFSLVLAACGGGNGNNTSSPSPSPSPSQSASAPSDSGQAPSGPGGYDPATLKATISIYYPTPDLVEKRALEDDKIRRFNEVFPNVEIVKSDWQYNPNEIGIKMGANEAPTLFNTYATEGKFLAEKGWAADITELFDAYDKKDQLNPILLDQFNLNGRYYGIPQQGYVVGTVINKKMLADKGVPLPPLDWTWEDMLNTAKGVADPAKGISGIAPMGKTNDAGWNWTNFLFEAGGEIQAIEGGKVVAKFNSEAGLKALEFYKQLKDANVIPADWALAWGDAVGAFAQSRTAMVYAGPDGPLDQALNQGGMGLNDLAVYPMPAMTKGGKHTGVLGGDFLVVNPNATPEEQYAAFQYAVFDYFSDEGLNSIEVNIQERVNDNKFFVPPVIQYFKQDSEYGRKVKAVYDKYDNVYQYSNELMNLLDGKPEAQFNTQDYYGAMTNVIQEVFSKDNVDLQAQLDAAAKMVQEQFYDHIVVE